MSGECRHAFVVTDGSYSDYQVHAVFDDEALACAWNDAYLGGRVEVFELNPRARELRAGLRSHAVSLWRNGDVRSVQACDAYDDSRDGWRRAWVTSSVCEEAGVEPGSVPPSLLVFTCCVVAPDEAAAVKVAGERRVRSLAAGEADAVPESQRTYPSVNRREVLAWLEAAGGEL